MSTRAPEQEKMTLEGPAGHIEALLEVPGDSPVDRVAVLCHPHPQYEGTMNNKVVHTLARAMNDLGLPALRFNFRGVGASDGEYADGLGETDDALAAIEWATSRFPGAELWLGGFSFGAMVAYRAAMLSAPQQLISIAPSAEAMRELGSGQPDCPWLIVQGGDDEVVSCNALVEWVNELEPGPELIVLPGVSHFFHGKLVLLRETLVANLKETAA